MWASIVALHYLVIWAYPPMFCSVGFVDPGGPILMIHVNEPNIWLHTLLMFSVLVLIPLGLHVGNETQGLKMPWVEVVAAYLLGLSLLVSPVDPRVMIADDPQIRRIVPLSFLFSVPWLLVRARVAASVMLNWLRHGLPRHDRLCMQCAGIFSAIGAAWLVAHRANWTPFGFDPLIVLLTAAHFHHAGFTLPLIAGLNAKAQPGCWTRFSCVAILIGVPLVAAGITCTHFGVLAFVEPFGVSILVLGALSVAISQVRLACQSELLISHRLLHAVSGISLLGAMFLALGFGLRHLLPWAALTMPQMWLIHGSLNAFGFGLCGLLGWRLMEHRRDEITARARQGAPR